MGTKENKLLSGCLAGLALLAVLSLVVFSITVSILLGVEVAQWLIN